MEEKTRETDNLAENFCVKESIRAAPRSKILQMQLRHVLFIGLILVVCTVCDLIIPITFGNGKTAANLETVVPEDCISFQSAPCSLLFIRTFPYTVITYCFSTSKSESLTIFDKITTNKTVWVGQDLRQVRNFLKISFENFDKNVHTTEEYYKTLGSLLKLKYTAEGIVKHGLVNNTYYLSHLAVYSLYKLLSY